MPIEPPLPRLLVLQLEPRFARKMAQKLNSLRSHQGTARILAIGPYGGNGR